MTLARYNGAVRGQQLRAGQDDFSVNMRISDIQTPSASEPEGCLNPYETLELCFIAVFERSRPRLLMMLLSVAEVCVMTAHQAI